MNKVLLLIAAGLTVASANAGAQTFTLNYTTIADATGGPSVSVMATILANRDPYTGSGGIPESYLPTSIVGTRGSAVISDTDPGYFYDNFSEFYYPATTSNVTGLGGAPTFLDGAFATLTYNINNVDFTLSRNNSSFYLETSNGVGRQINAANFSIAQVNAVTAVPEPASWAIIILGMGAVGFALRRHQKVTTRVSYAV